MARSAASSAMVGRSQELAELTAALDAARGHECVTVVLGGEAGVGKTRLVTEFAARAEAAGARSVTGHCVELGRDGLPYAPISGALRSMVREVGDDRFRELAGTSLDALTGVVPELGPHVSGDSDGRGRLFDGVTDVLERASEQQPLVVVVEDLHWSDGSTRDLLRFAVRALARSRVLLVLTYRSDDVPRSHPLRPFVAELDRLPSVRRISLGRLSDAEVVEQVEGIWGRRAEQEVLDRIQRRSEGVPFFVEELVDAETTGGSGSLPDTLRDLLMVRTDRLDARTQAMLRLMTLGGARVSHRLLVAVSEDTPEDLEASLREAVSCGVLVVEGDGYAFRHALLREALREDMLPGESARIHLRYADVLERQPDIKQHATSARAVAYHLDHARDYERAFRAYIDAADLLRRGYAFREAQEAYEHALDLWGHVTDPASAAGTSRVQLIIHAARSARDAGELERGIALVASGRDEIGDDSDLHQRIALAILETGLLRDLGRPEASALTDAIEMLPADGADGLRATVLGYLSARQLCDARFEEAVVTARETAAASQRAESTLEEDVAENQYLKSQMVLGPALIQLGQVQEGLEVLDAAKDVTAVTPKSRALYYINTSDCLNLLGRYRASADVASAGIDKCADAGLARTLGAMVAGNAAEPLLALGEWDRAEQLITRALELDPPLRHRWHLQRLKAWLWLWRGDVDAAEKAVRQQRDEIGDNSPDPQYTIPFARVAAEVALERGDPGAAWGLVEECLDRPGHAAGYDLPLLATGARALGARARAGDRDESAVARVRVDLNRIGVWGPSAIWGAVIDAEIAGDTGEEAAAWEAVLQDDLAPVHLAPYAGLRLARAALTAGDRDGAAAALQQASTESLALGSGLLSDQIDDLARRARLPLVGAEDGRQHGANGGADRDDGLTSREHEVLALVARGRTNRQIGDELFITAKTASVHVSNILAKLGVSGRGEAAAVARDSGLVDGPAAGAVAADPNGDDRRTRT